jgi:hypothetical protein
MADISITKRFKSFVGFWLEMELDTFGFPREESCRHLLSRQLSELGKEELPKEVSF